MKFLEEGDEDLKGISEYFDEDDDDDEDEEVNSSQISEEGSMDQDIPFRSNAKRKQMSEVFAKNNFCFFAITAAEYSRKMEKKKRIL